MALWGSLQVKFGLSYIAVIAAVLLLLNTYPLLVSEDLVFRSKETNMTGSVSVVVYSLAGLNRLNQENVAAAMAVVEETGLSRVLVTDSAGLVLYDTRETAAPLENTPSIPRSCRHWRDMTPFPAPTGTVPSAAARPLRCCIRTGSSARCTPTNMTQSRRRCWKDCKATS